MEKKPGQKETGLSLDAGALRDKGDSVYRLVVESIHDGLYTVDRKGRFTFVNDIVVERSGYPREWFIGRSLFEIVEPEDRDRVSKGFQAVMRGEKVVSFELSYTSGSGQLVWVEIKASPLRAKKSIVGALVISRDITGRKGTDEKLQREISERKKTEEALRSSEAYYRAIFQNTGTAMVIMEEDTTISLVNAECKHFVGYAPRELEGRRKAIDFVAKADLEKVLENRQARLTDPDKPPKSYEFKIVDRYGKAKDVLMTVAVIPEMRRIIASFIDIGERRKMEEALKESEEKYRDIFENVMEGIFRLTPEGAFVDVNPAFATILGYLSPKEVLKSLRDIFYEVYADPALTDELKGLLEKEGFVRDFEIECRRKDGKRMWVSTSVRAMRAADGRCLFYEGTLVDITERKRIQQDLESKSRSLEETNAALRVLLRQREEDKAEVEEKVLHNLKELVLPYLEKLKMRPDADRVIVDVIEANINDVLSPFIKSMAAKYVNFTPKEIQVADLMKKGKTTKEISQLLNLSPRTIDIHRYNIRRKLNINKKKINLQAYLLTLS